MEYTDVNMQQQTAQLHGLTSAQVEESRRLYGDNVLTPPPRDPWWKLYLQKFEDPVIRILIIAAVITLIVGFVDGHFAEGVGIIIAILLATTLGFVNEYRASREFDVLNQVSDDAATSVIRDGVYISVPRRDLVVGDLVLLEEGMEIPADGLVRESIALQVNESLLTGESMPVHKVVSNGTALDDHFHEDKLSRSTLVVGGRGLMEVTAVGDRTRIGEIAHAATGDTDDVTPLNAQLERLSKLIGVVGFTVAALTYVALIARGVAMGELVLAGEQWAFVALLTLSGLTALTRIWLPIVYDAFELAGRPRELPAWLMDGARGWLIPAGAGVAVFIAGLLLGRLVGIIPADPALWLPGSVGSELLRYFMVSVTIIVVAVPEGLPMSVTLSLAYSMRRMTASNNLVRRMHATETVGAATVICSDKTGTLTLNQMRVSAIGFPALGERPMTSLLETEIEGWIAEAISANTTAHLSRQPGEPIRMMGDGTEGALLLWLELGKLDYIQHRNAFRLINQLTFSADRKYMATLGQSAVSGEIVLHVKGAPEIVLDQCDSVLTPYGVESISAHREQIDAELLDYQRRGMRTLGFAFRRVYDPDETDLEALAEHLIWLGYVAIADPIRPEVPSAIQACRTAGIKVKVVTGDTAETAKEIARQIGLWDDADEQDAYAHLSGRDFAALDDQQAREAVKHVKVLSRARPMDKMRLVNLLQENGEIVAVTGDGTNDAPALNFANVGLAMGSGTDIAKEASDIVLLDDSFSSIVNAVKWGRSLYQNIQRFILFQLTINVAALGIALLGPFIGVQFPLTVIQMLWVNLIMDTFASLALATEPPHNGVLQRPPRKASDFIIAPLMSRRILSLGAVFIVVLVGALFLIRQDGLITDVELSLFYASFVLLQFWNLFNARVMGRDASAFSGILQNRAFLIIALVILIGTILIVQFGGEIFRTVPLDAGQWIAILALTSPVLLVPEALRLLQSRRAGAAAA